MISKKTVPLTPPASPAKPAARRTSTRTSGTKAALPAASQPRAAGKTPATETKPAARTSQPVKATPARPLAAAGKTAASQAPAPGKAAARKTAPVSATGMVTLTEASQVVRKPRPVRDSFTMSEAEYALLVTLKQACFDADYEVKKSELVRVGIGLVAALDVVALKDLLAGLAPVKPGRAKKA